MRSLRKSWPAVALFALVLGAEAAQGQGLPPVAPAPARHLIYANRYRVVDRAGGFDDLVTIGHYDFLDDRTVRVWYLQYDGKRDAQATVTRVRNPDILGARAEPGPIRIPKYTAVGQFRGSYVFDGKRLRIRIGTVLHDWEVRDAASGLLVLRGPYTNAEDGSHVIEGLTHVEGSGYGYFANQIAMPGRLTRENLLPVYDGEIDSLARRGEQLLGWQHSRTQFHFDQYRAYGPDVLAHVTMDQKLRPPMYVFSTVLLNYAPHSNLLLYHNGGHDFNRNAVFDDLGHTIQMFGVYEGGKVEKMVFIEYSYQTRGYPLLSVGRYYNPRPVHVAARPALPAPMPEEPGTLPPPRRYEEPPLYQPPTSRRPFEEAVPLPRRTEEAVPPPQPYSEALPRETDAGWVWRPREQRWQWAPARSYSPR